MNKGWSEFIMEEEGVGVVEIILILVVLLALVLIFKDKISKIVDKALKAIQDDSSKIIG